MESALQKRLFSVIKQESDTAAMKTKLRSIFDDAVSSMAEVERKAPGFSQAAIDGQIKSLLSPWFRYFLTYDPKPVLMELKCAVLAINGEKDLQVPPGPNLAVINKALMAGGNKHFTTLELTGLNHLFQTAKTGSPEEYATIEETMSPTAMKTIGDWILSRTK